MPPSKHALQSRIPLYVPHREYPRPNAKVWLQRASAKFGLDSPLNHGSPWLPLTAIEGFIVLGHKDAAAAPCEIPPELTILVRLRPKDYDRIASRCMEALTAFQNDLPRLATAWALHLAKAADADRPKGKEASHSEDESRRRRVMHAMQFIVDHALTQRPIAGKTAKEFLKEHPSVRWCIDCLGAGQAIFPLDDLQSSRVQSGLIPATVASKFKAICYERDDDGLHVLLPAGTPVSVFKTDLSARFDQSPRVNVAFADPEAITQFVDNASVMSSSPNESVNADEASDSAELDCGEDQQLLQQKMDTIADARDVLRRGLAEALATGATDMHIDPLDQSSAVIRLRYNGILRARGTITTTMATKVISVIKIRSKMNSTETRLPQGGKFPVRAGARQAEVRVSTIPVQKGIQGQESCALRILGRVKISGIDQIGMSPYAIQQLRWVMRRENGIFLVTGPTGSGKTTTLNCVMKEIAEEGINAMSIEDPVEIQIPWVKQMQVHNEIGLTFPEALPHYLRHDPDVIMVGEIRDDETAKIAMQAAQTGHLVFSTLHTNSALMSIARLDDLGIHRSMTAGSLVGVAAQRLVRCLCPSCREAVPIDPEQQQYVRKYRERLRAVRVRGESSQREVTSKCPDARELEDVIDVWLNAGQTYRPGECTVCNNSGFHKQQAVAELYLLGNESTAIDMIIDGKPITELQRFFAEAGHLDLSGQALRALVRHETTFDEIKQHLPLL